MKIKKFMMVLFGSLFIVALVYSEDYKQAELHRVDDGVFHLREGETIDLTDRFLLLAFRSGKTCQEIMINGRNSCIKVGDRFDLKYQHAPFFLGELFSDKNRCFLDIVKIEALKGAETNATFRLHCV